MKLQTILCDSLTGFTMGLGLSLCDPAQSLEEKLEFSELYVAKEERETKGLTDNRIKELKRYAKIPKWTLPFFFGSFYSLLTSSGSSASYLEKMMVAMPAVYIGRFVGGAMRRMRHRKNIATLNKALKDKENLELYLLSEKEITRTKKIFNKVEKATFEEKELSFYEKDICELWSIMANKNKFYETVLKDWSMKKIKEAIESAAKQRSLSAFYEEAKAANDVIGYTIWGKPEYLKVKVFTKEADKFYIQTVNWPNLKIEQHLETGFSFIEAHPPTIIESERVTWRNDYEVLLNRIQKESNSYSIMLMNSPSETSKAMRAMIVMQYFLEEFEKYKREKMMEKSDF